MRSLRSFSSRSQQSSNASRSPKPDHHGGQAVASWLRSGDLGDDFRLYYYFLGSLGRNVKSVVAILGHIAVRVIEPGDRLFLAIDDTPIKRYGPLVAGAGIHHKPTLGPTETNFLYGHVWATLSWVVLTW